MAAITRSIEQLYGLPEGELDIIEEEVGKEEAKQDAEMAVEEEEKGEEEDPVAMEEDVAAEGAAEERTACLASAADVCETCETSGAAPTGEAELNLATACPPAELGALALTPCMAHQPTLSVPAPSAQQVATGAAVTTALFAPSRYSKGPLWVERRCYGACQRPPSPTSAGGCPWND